jgi:hypothetical protein
MPGATKQGSSVVVVRNRKQIALISQSCLFSKKKTGRGKDLWEIFMRESNKGRDKVGKRTL